MAAGLAIGLFCSASDGLPDAYRAAAAEFGRLCAARGFRLVYGGSARGLMGIRRRPRRRATTALVVSFGLPIMMMHDDDDDDV